MYVNIITYLCMYFLGELNSDHSEMLSCLKKRLRKIICGDRSVNSDTVRFLSQQWEDLTGTYVRIHVRRICIFYYLYVDSFCFLFYSYLTNLSFYY